MSFKKLSNKIICLTLILFTANIYGIAHAEGEARQYLSPSLKNLSKIYWKIGGADLNNDEHLDSHLLINECGIYQNYFSDDFQWHKIRNTTRESIENNKDAYSTRIRYVQPIKFGAYDFDSNAFKVLDDYDFKGIRRFQVLSNEFEKRICNRRAESLPGFPSGMVVEYTRPFTLTSVPVSPDLAEKYIEEKREPFLKLRRAQQTEERLHEFRDAYIVFEAEILRYRNEVTVQSYNMASVYARMDGYKIYADRDLTQLLHEKLERRKTPISDFEKQLREKYKSKMEAKDLS